MEIKKTYWLFLAAIAAATLFFYSSCGGGKDTTPESDTVVSEDSSLGDNQKPDNFIPPDTTPPENNEDNLSPDTTNIETEETEVETDPCDNEKFAYLMKLKGKELKCGKDICKLELFKGVEGQCLARCKPAFYEDANDLEKVDDNQFQFSNSAGTFTCSPSSN